MNATAKEIDRLKMQIGALDVFASELQELEQWKMPSEWRERALKIRNESAPMFFNLVAALLQDALIQGLANILDRPSTLGRDNLTLEFVIQSHPDPAIQAACMAMLTNIRNGSTYADIKRARNKVLSHSDYETTLNYNTLTSSSFPGLKLVNLQSLVGDIVGVMAKLAGEPIYISESIPQNWQGVSVLFKILERTSPPEHQQD
jgi:hypothetical protein